MTKPRAPRSDAAATAIRAARNAAAKPLDPPAHVVVRDGDRPFWRSIIASRSRDEWAEADLVVGAQLARTMADIEAESRTLEAEGLVAGGRVNPRAAVVDQLSKRAMALMRTLRMGGKIAGPARDLQNKRFLERQAATVRAELLDEDEDGLLA